MNTVRGPAIVAILKAALVKFGRIDRHNRDQVTDWVLRQVKEFEQSDASAGTGPRWSGT